MQAINTLGQRPNWFLVIGGLLLALTCGVNLFLYIGVVPIANWDEARHGISAYEMLQSGDYLVNTCRNTPDYWNVKPPLSFWAIAASFKLFGVSVFGFRFASALSILLTIGMVVLFTGKRFSWSAGLLAGALLVTAETFILEHNARTGNADALFVFLTTSAVFSALKAKEHLRWLYVSCALLALGFLTKSFHIIPSACIVIGLALWIRGYEIFRFRVFGTCLLCGILPVLLWAAARYSVDGTVFFERMWHLDVYKRVTTFVEGHTGSGPLFYIHILRLNFESSVLLLVAWFVGLMLYALQRRCAIKDLFHYDNKIVLWQLAFCVVLTLVLFHCSTTKLKWYIYPIIPFVAILLGVSLDVFFRRLWDLWASKCCRVAVVCTLLAFCGLQEYRLIGGILSQVQKQDATQQALQDMSQQVRGVAVYLEHGGWEQKDVLAAQIHGDFLAMDGGVESWKKDGNATAVLLSPNGQWQTKSW